MLVANTVRIATGASLLSHARSSANTRMRPIETASAAETESIRRDLEFATIDYSLEKFHALFLADRRS
jgi:hypothetical protein